MIPISASGPFQFWLQNFFMNDSNCEPSIAYSNSVSKLEIKTFEIVNIFGNSFLKCWHIMQNCSSSGFPSTRPAPVGLVVLPGNLYSTVCSLSSVYNVYLLDETIHTRQQSTIMHYPRWQCALNKQSHTCVNGFAPDFVCALGYCKQRFLHWASLALLPMQQQYQKQIWSEIIIMKQQ